MYPPMTSNPATLTGMQFGALVFDTSDSKLKLYKDGTSGPNWYALEDTSG